MQIHRNAYQRLLQWKTSGDRKPLLIRGARQVGKTTLVRNFSREFANYTELNLEREADKALFEIDSVGKLLNAVYLRNHIADDSMPTLLFIDEIQESPRAIQQLRYFYEERPGLFVISAGSLLEFALKDVPQFPVGRIDYLYLSPLNFGEYLAAIGNSRAVDALKTTPLPDYAHRILLDLFHEYALVGGMPEAVSKYVEGGNAAGLPGIYNRLWQAFKDDVEKYARNNTERKVIRHVIAAAPHEPDRIRFEGFGRSNYRSREVGEALRALDLARVIQLIYPTTSLAPPIASDLKKRPRLQFVDTGILNHALNLQGEMIAVNDLNNFYKGRIIQHLVYQELISIHEDVFYKPHFWVREEKDSNAEVDLVFRSGKYIVPIEIKAGRQGTLRSLHQFVERTAHPYAVRMYAGPFKIERVKTPGGEPYTLMNMPYFLGTRIPEYLAYLVRQGEKLKDGNQEAE